VRVRLETTRGAILLALDTRRAPITAGNFLAYVDDGRLDGTEFYRAARSKRVPGTGFIQGGVRQNAWRALPPIPLEPTSRTGLRHTDGAISMARGQGDASATGNFTIAVGAQPSLDAKPGFPGYAAFGRVVGGTDTVKRILAEPSGGGQGVMRGQMILQPVRIVRAVRIDGTPKPTGRPKIWQMLEGVRNRR
jgi:peptidyl-prolyl cis-trans isomerase A (cyclophilin A)